MMDDIFKYKHKFGIVYEIKNIITDDVYIGQTTRLLGKRKFEHENRDGVMSNVISNFGSENFTWRILCECLDIESLNTCEDFIIKYYRNSGHTLYNKMEGGKNSTHSSETKRSIGKSNSGKNHPFYGKSHTKESKKTISDNRVLYTGNSSPFYNKNHTEESKRKMSGKKLNTYIFHFEDGSYEKYINIQQKDLCKIYNISEKTFRLLYNRRTPYKGITLIEKI